MSGKDTDPTAQTCDPFLPERENMVQEHLRPRGIRDPRVLDAMATVPRERFVPADWQNDAYFDQALPIGEGQTISQPYIVAYMTEQLELAPQHRVLEVGTGSGYQTAILARLAAHVYSIERIEELRRRAAALLVALGVNNLTLGMGDGSMGWLEHAPYDRIIVTAGAPHLPRALVDQLTEGGRIIVPVGGPGEQKLVRVHRLAGRVVEVPLIDCRFVRLIGQNGWKTERSCP